MNTLSAKPFLASASLATSRFANVIRHLIDSLSSRHGALPGSAARLMAMADEYERSQPGYASDLRAAAQRALDGEPRTR